MKQAYLPTILGMPLLTLACALGLAVAPRALAQDVHPETPSGAEEEEQLQQTEQQDQTTGGTTQQAAPAEEEEEDNGPKRIWRNSTIFFDQGVSGWTLTNEGHTPNPTSSTLIRFQPRVYFDENTFLRLRQDFSLEETASDTTTYNGQPIFGDGLLDLMRANIVKAGDFTLSAGGRLTIPWSIGSQANRTFFGVGAVVDATYTFPHVLEGLSISMDAFANYYVSDTNIAHVASVPNQVNGYPCMRAAPNSGGDPSGLLSGTCDSLGGSSTTGFSVLFGPIFSLTPFKHFNIAAIVFSWVNVGRDLATGYVPTATGTVTLPDMSRTHVRNEEVLYLSFTYSLTKYFDLSLNYYAFTPLLDPQGNWRNPFWGPDQQFSLTAFFTLDQLYNAITGETHDPARAQHARTAARAAGGML